MVRTDSFPLEKPIARSLENKLMSKQSKEKQSGTYRSKIGGQALIDGIMMRGVEKSAMACRMPDGSIHREVWDTNPGKKKSVWKKIPIIRGCISFVQSILSGYRCMMKSAELTSDLEEDEEEETGRVTQWILDHFGDKLIHGATVVGTVLGVVLAIVLFMYLPSLAVMGLDQLVDLGYWKSVIEGVIKILILVGYLTLVGLIGEIKKTYRYHGAEHKTIFCLENGLPLTVENIRKQRRFHPRCGTSFLILVLLVSILVSSLVTWDTLWLRVVLKILVLPIIMGISFELIQFAGRHDNLLTKIISAPGLWLQRLTVLEPDDGMIECAIEAITPCIPEDREKDQW